MKARLFFNWLLTAITFLILGTALWLPFLFTNDEILANFETFWGLR
jgi:hypothetical protein